MIVTGIAITGAAVAVAVLLLVGRDRANEDAARYWNDLAALEQRAALRHDPAQTRAFMETVDVELKPLDR